MKLNAPFPWFGGKRRVARLVWERFGDVPNYVEPFAGSLAVLLARPTPPQVETVNDIDCLLTNFWRAVKYAPNEVAEFADWPVSELDLHARHAWLIAQKPEVRERLRSDPQFFDAKVAGWWVWGAACWIGGGWGARNAKQIPHLHHAKGRGVVALAHSDRLHDTLQALQRRLRHVRICCGDWNRVLTKAVLFEPAKPCAVFLDPPYGSERAKGLYANDDQALHKQVDEWARRHGGNSNLRIALCGLEGEHDLPGWDCVAWKAKGGYNNRTGGKNAHRERIWFSPHCLQPDHQLKLLG